MIKYHKKDLFSAPSGSIILHATNCKGVWGNGIAKTFAIKFPNAFKAYVSTCRTNGPKLAGSVLLIPTAKYTIGCLFTSKKYGMFKDKKEEILDQTGRALCDLINRNKHRILENKPLEFHLPKINSGLFAVPWNETEKLIKDVDKAAENQGYRIIWNIYAP